MRGLLIIAILSMLILTGCGETINGIGKDAQRVGKGIKTVFFKNSD